jgi:hypothetical protein
MKKTVMFVVLILLAISGVFAQVSVAGQTFYYKYVESVDAETGVRSIIRGGNDDMYITFTANSCYTSDEKGIVKPIFDDDVQHGVRWSTRGDGILKFQGESNNLYVFFGNYTETISGFSRTNVNKLQRYFYFSKDYKRMNIRHYDESNGKWYSNIAIYERIEAKKEEPQKAPEAPKQLW